MARSPDGLVVTGTAAVPRAARGRPWRRCQCRSAATLG